MPKASLLTYTRQDAHLLQSLQPVVFALKTTSFSQKRSKVFLKNDARLLVGRRGKEIKSFSPGKNNENRPKGQNQRSLNDDLGLRRFHGRARVLAPANGLIPKLRKRGDEERNRKKCVSKG